MDGKGGGRRVARDGQAFRSSRAQDGAESRRLHLRRFPERLRPPVRGPGRPRGTALRVRRRLRRHEGAGSVGTLRAEVRRRESAQQLLLLRPYLGAEARAQAARGDRAQLFGGANEGVAALRAAGQAGLGWPQAEGAGSGEAGAGAAAKENVSSCPSWPMVTVPPFSSAPKRTCSVSGS